MVKIIFPEDMTKEAFLTHKLFMPIATALGTAGTLAYAGAYLKDRAERQMWQRKIEEQLRSQGKPVNRVNIPENTPLVIMNDEEKKGTLLTKLAEARRALTLPDPMVDSASGL